MSKLGPHIITSTVDARAWALYAPIVKQLDNTDCLRFAPFDAITVFRKYFPDSDAASRIVSLAVAPTITDILADLKGFIPSYIDGPFNEIAQRQFPFPLSDSHAPSPSLQQYADFMHLFVPQMKHALPGVKIAGFAFSTGNPGSREFNDPDDAQYLYNRKFCGVDAISMHCYFPPYPTLWGRSYAFRYRAFHDALPQGSCPPILITECGIDDVPHGAKGWRSATPPLSADQYIALLAQYDAALSADPYVLGATVFTAGALPAPAPTPTSPWAAYSTDGTDMSRFYEGADPHPMPTPTLEQLEQRVAALEQRDTYITQALHRILTGDYTGPTGAAADVVALQGGNDDITPLVRTPQYPLSLSPDDDQAQVRQA